MTEFSPTSHVFLSKYLYYPSPSPFPSVKSPSAAPPRRKRPESIQVLPEHGSGSAFDGLFLGDGDGPGDGYDEDGSGLRIVGILGDDPLVPNPPPASSRSWPNQSRAIQYYNEVKSLTLDTQHLYCPLKRNNTLFDSFRLERSPKGVVLWVFQMTIAKEHRDAVSGFTILSTIVQKIRATLTASEGVEVKFVLVAPHKHGQVVKWNFPKELGDPSSDQVYGPISGGVSRRL